MTAPAIAARAGRRGAEAERPRASGGDADPARLRGEVSEDALGLGGDVLIADALRAEARPLHAGLAERGEPLPAAGRRADQQTSSSNRSDSAAVAAAAFPAATALPTSSISVPKPLAAKVFA